MASKPISELVEITSPLATDILAIVNSFETKKIQLLNLVAKLVKTEIDNTDSPYTQLSTDIMVYSDTSSGDMTINMLSAVTMEDRTVTIKSLGTGETTLVASGAELIETDTNLILTENDSVTLHSNGTQWYII